tara:strand:- start:519 stop:863 length:345 start_codon:yes stop_codon:yes gene_type:complete
MPKHAIDEHVGKKLRHFRTLANITQTQLAKELGVSFQQVQKYEIGSNRVSASKLYETAKFMEVPISAFFPEDASDTSEFESIEADEAALIRAYRAATPDVRRAIHSFTQSLDAA